LGSLSAGSRPLTSAQSANGFARLRTAHAGPKDFKNKTNSGRAPALPRSQHDLLTPILRLAASPNGLLITKHVARDARDVALALRKLVWKDRIPKCSAIIKGHVVGNACSCAFSPDGKRIVTASEDGTPMVWDAETGSLLLTLQGHDEGITSCAFLPDNKRVVTVSN